MAINATMVWRVRPSGSDTNGGGFDATISGAGTDYSQQNAAQASGTNGATTGTTAFTDTVANAFTAQMVGNVIYISGTGQTTGFYVVVAFVSASQVTLDRSPGTGTGATWFLGGAWRSFANFATTGPLVPGNTVYILGSGVPNPASYTFDYTVIGQPSWTQGNFSAGQIRFLGDPNTPNFSSGGRPVIQGTSWLAATSWAIFRDLYFVFTSGSLASQDGVIYANGFPITLINCVLDQNGYDAGLIGGANGAAIENAIGCEVFSSVSARGTKAQPAIQFGDYTYVISFNNIHDTVGPGIDFNASGSRPGNVGVIFNNIISKVTGTGLRLQVPPTVSPLGDQTFLVANNTIDGNSGHGIEFVDQQTLACCVCINNIISNHVTSGTFGMTVDAGAAAANDLIKGFVDYNTFYNNTTDVNAISYGTHDTHGGVNPYVNQSTENYTLANP